eukprot:15365083-Ditylum_brightwellii.AAC.1
MAKTVPRLAFFCSCVGGWEWKSCEWVQHQIHTTEEKQKYSKDKIGYRSRLAAWRCGRQLTLQPDYAKSNMMFRGLQTIKSASVATDHSGNKPIMNLCKLLGVLKRGLYKYQS